MYRASRVTARLALRSRSYRFSSLARLRASDDKKNGVKLEAEIQSSSLRYSSSLGSDTGASDSISLETNLDHERTNQTAGSQADKEIVVSDDILDSNERSNGRSNGWSKAHSSFRKVESLQNCRFELRPAKRAPGDRCRDRAAIVTGGTSGIGFAVVKRLVLEGASRVIILTRDLDRGYQVTQRIKEATGLDDAPVTALEYDQTVNGFPPELGDLARHINTCITCAGVSQSFLLAHQKPSKVDELIDVNLKAPMALGKYLMKRYFDHVSVRRQAAKPNSTISHRSTQPSYCVVNVSSLLANKGGYGASTYAATKAGIIAYTRVLALEAAEFSKRHKDYIPPFRANVVVPGYINTPMLDGIKGEARENLQNEIPLGRFGTPDEVADAILFLITNEYANNCVLSLDGGLSAT